MHPHEPSEASPMNCWNCWIDCTHLYEPSRDDRHVVVGLSCYMCQLSLFVSVNAPDKKLNRKLQATTFRSAASLLEPTKQGGFTLLPGYLAAWLAEQWPASVPASVSLFMFVEVLIVRQWQVCVRHVPPPLVGHPLHAQHPLPTKKKTLRTQRTWLWGKTNSTILVGR